MALNNTVTNLSAVNMQPQQQAPQRTLTVKEIKTMNQCQSFVNTVTHILNEINTTGSTQHRSLPTFPRAALLNIMCDSGVEQKHLLRGQELHLYLLSKIVEINENTAFEIPAAFASPVNANMTVEQIGEYLKHAAMVLNNNKSRLLKSSFNFGKLLKECRYFYTLQKGAGIIHVAWAEYLKETIGYSDSHVRHLTFIYEKFGSFSTMYKLAIPVTELYNRRDEIEYMLHMNPEYRRFWIGQ